MKILLVNDYKKQIGGAEKYLWTLKEELEKKGHEVIIFGSGASKEKYIHDQKVKSLFIYAKRLFNIKKYLEFKKIINEFQPDVIHLHNIFNEITPSILLATKNIPVIMTIHDSQIVNPVSILSDRTGKECKKRTCGGCINCVGPKGALYEFLKRRLHRQLLKKVSLYVTPSKYMRDFVKEAGFDPVVAVPNGIKLFEYSEIKNFNKLLYVGRLTKEKGVVSLLNIMPKLVKNFPNLELTLAGDGTDKSNFTKLATELKILNNVKFMGLVKSNGVEKLYKETTLVIMPSLWNEPFGLVGIEAMSVGRPVIASNVGAIPEWLENNKSGFLVNPKNLNQFSGKIIELLTNTKLLKNMGNNARKNSKKYILKDHIEKILFIYKNTIK